MNEDLTIQGLTAVEQWHLFACRMFNGYYFLFSYKPVFLIQIIIKFR